LLLVTSFLVLPATPARAAAAGWIVTCQFSHAANDDPIVSPGQPGVSHLHVYYGSRDTNASSTSESLRAGGTTCAMPGDASAYWIPAVFAQGRQLAPGTARHALFYYRRIAAPTGVTVSSIPDGLRFIVGRAHAQSPSDNPLLGSRIAWRCGTGSGRLPAPPADCAAQTMVVIIQAPNCWDGVHLDSADHISHMAYPGRSRCPASHPVVLSRVESYFRFRIASPPLGEVTLSSGPWWTIHQDFYFAWDPSELQRFVDRCINRLVNCGQNPT
jgi:Domain of unknown function (DUF1996)